MANSKSGLLSARTLVRLRDLIDRFRQSLFFVPLLFVIGSLFLVRLMSALDGWVDPAGLPDFLAATPESSRSLLGTIASGTIAAASIVFSMMLVALQLSASRYSPRAMRDFIRDGFMQIVMGIEVATVTYALFVLSEVRNIGDVVRVPQLSVAVGIVLAVAALIALLAGVDHLAKSVQVSSLARRVAHETIDLVRRVFDGGQMPALFMAPGVAPSDLVGIDLPRDSWAPIVARTDGWVQQVDARAIFESLPHGAVFEGRVAVGSFVSTATVLGWVTPALPDEKMRRVGTAFDIGAERTMQQDVGYGLLRLEDMALLALSPAINDLNTASEVIVRIGSVLAVLMTCDLGGVELRDEDRVVRWPVDADFGRFVGAAFDQLRTVAAPHPKVLAVLLRTLGSLAGEARRIGKEGSIPALVDQAALILQRMEETKEIPLAVDRAFVKSVAVKEGLAQP